MTDSVGASLPGAALSSPFLDAFREKLARSEALSVDEASQLLGAHDSLMAAYHSGAALEAPPDNSREAGFRAALERIANYAYYINDAGGVPPTLKKIAQRALEAGPQGNSQPAIDTFDRALDKNLSEHWKRIDPTQPVFLEIDADGTVRSHAPLCVPGGEAGPSPRLPTDPRAHRLAPEYLARTLRELAADNDAAATDVELHIAALEAELARVRGESVPSSDEKIAPHHSGNDSGGRASRGEEP